MAEQDPEPRRPQAQLIYGRVIEDARDELARPSGALMLSGLFAGFTVGASPAAYALALALLPPGGAAELIAALVFPVGFIAVILGRAQLFTENTLYPVVASFEDPGLLRGTARLWAAVLAGNVIGGVLFALLVIETPALSAEFVAEFSHLGSEVEAGGFGEDFWSGILAGWALATVAWLVEAADAAIGQAAAIWFVVMLMGLGQFEHSVASAIEVAGAMFDGAVGFGEWAGWLATVVLANALGGVLIVALLNYGQVQGRQSESE